MTKIDRALIVGAGIGGLGASTMLATAGAEVEIAEIKPDSTVFGVGINQPGNSLRALRKIGVLPEILAEGFEYNATGFYDYRSQLIVQVPSQLGDDDVPNNCALPRKSLHRVLVAAADRAGVAVHYGTTVADFEQDDDGVHITFSDGRQADYDVLIAFDGIKSDMRRRLFPEAAKPAYTGYAVWRVTVPRPPEAINCDIFQSPHVKAGYIPLSQETMYLLLVAPEPADHHYDRADFPRLLRERLQEFNGIIGDIRDNLSDNDDIVYSPLSEVLLPPPWSQGRVGVAGDAAHACTPHITQGAAMALEDAVVLADELESGDTVAASLLSFAARRYPRAKFVQEVSRGILEAEMAITAETLPIAIEHMAAELPGQMDHVDAFLRQPA